jgi:hypothetical protein
MAGIGVAPAQVTLELAGQHGVVGRTGPNWALIGLAQEALVGVRHSSTWLRLAQRRMAGALLADRLSKVT